MKGATRLDAAVPHYNPSFNPRAREGRDATAEELFKGAEGFNPRAREGRDKEEDEPVKTNKVSIHAPVKGATTRRACSW